MEKIQKEFVNGIYISSLTVAELEYGVSNSSYPDSNRLALMKFLSIFDLLYYDETDAISYGQIKTDLKKKGFLIGPIDLLLASQAVSKNLIMVTIPNRKWFSQRHRFLFLFYISEAIC